MLLIQIQTIYKLVLLLPLLLKPVSSFMAKIGYLDAKVFYQDNKTSQDIDLIVITLLRYDIVVLLVSSHHEQFRNFLIGQINDLFPELVARRGMAHGSFSEINQINSWWHLYLFNKNEFSRIDGIGAALENDVYRLHAETFQLVKDRQKFLTVKAGSAYEDQFSMKKYVNGSDYLSLKKMRIYGQQHPMLEFCSRLGNCDNRCIQVYESNMPSGFVNPIKLIPRDKLDFNVIYEYKFDTDQLLATDSAGPNVPQTSASGPHTRPTSRSPSGASHSQQSPDRFQRHRTQNHHQHSHPPTHRRLTGSPEPGTSGIQYQQEPEMLSAGTDPWRVGRPLQVPYSTVEGFNMTEFQDQQTSVDHRADSSGQRHLEGTGFHYRNRDV